MRVIIVGGVAGGMSAATRLRRLDNDAEIIVIERSGHVSYANCGLPYFVGGVIEHEESLLLQTPASLHERFRIDVRVNAEVTGIDPASRSVRVRNLSVGSDYELTYDRLVLSPGASPVIPAIPGIERAMALRTVEDVEHMVAAVERSPRHALVIGGGFIGVEIAENLVERGIATSVVEATGQLLAPLDPEMAQLVADEMRRHGVRVYLNDSVEAVTASAVQLTSGEVVPADLVVVAIGVRPDTQLAREAGLSIGGCGGIAVDEYNRTSDPAIYAIGDAAEKSDALDGAATLVPLANIANRHGRVVADHIAGRTVRPLATIGTAIVKVFDLTIAATGWNEKRLRAGGRDVLAIHTHPGSHAGYYPGAKTIALKMLIDPVTGAILGAQGVGVDGVDKRIDVIATAMRGGISAPELADLELAYAPPFGSAKDPVNMLGYIAENILSGLVQTVQWNEVDEYRAKGAQLIDVRTRDEFARGSLPGAVNVPVDEIRERVDELDASSIVVICQVGQRGHTATLLLNELGFEAKNLDGGYKTWSSSPAVMEPELVG
ncbi:MAG TPA: FAD-dependent oxidoreductase [Acidimicrobiales bacterium]|nr:FAD-dependent oxidoreductase [Acidimicrobiales bacterium]